MCGAWEWCCTPCWLGACPLWETRATSRCGNAHACQNDHRALATWCCIGKCLLAILGTSRLGTKVGIITEDVPHVVFVGQAWRVGEAAGCGEALKISVCRTCAVRSWQPTSRSPSMSALQQRDLLLRMLTVDPTRRITLPQVRCCTLSLALHML